MKTKTMTMTTALAAILAGGGAHSQTPPADWSWTFQRWGDTCGLLFEDAGLAAPVKAAIRDDFCRAYSFSSSTNLFTKAYPSDHPKYGEFDGFDGLQGDRGCPSGLSGRDYKLHNGSRYLHVETQLSSRYLEKIALTNQHQAAVASLSNFLATVNSATTNNVVQEEYLTHWWILSRNRTPTEEDVPDPGDFIKFVESCSNVDMLAPSILNFQIGTGELAGELCYKVLFRNREGGGYEHSENYLIYKNGKWRFVLLFY